MKEKYKQIENYTNYAVSNLGNVKNVKTGLVLKPADAGHGYLRVGLFSKGEQKNLCVHKLVASAFLEKVENKTVVDHRDGDKTNNNVSNLRFCSQQQNSRNTSKRKAKTATSKYKGVYCHTKNKNWIAQIQVGKKRIHIGCYKTEMEAGKAYDVKAKELFGEFAKLNF